MDILAELKKIPPVTRFLCASSLAVTGATIASIVSPYSVIFAKELVLKKFEVLIILEFKILSNSIASLDMEVVHEFLLWR
jgi:hypothetical protein